MSSDDEMYLEDSDSDEENTENENLNTAKSVSLDGIEQNDWEDRDEADNTVLNHETLEKEMNKTISDVQAILQVKPGICRILLQKYKWNKESLFERFYENPDTNAFLTDAHVIPEKVERVSAEYAECEICFDVRKLTGLACNHRACTECWNAYLTDKIVDGQCEIKCMASNCKLLIENEQIIALISDPAVIILYRRWIVNSYVETNKLLKWCPGINCGKAVKVSHCEPRLVVCTCGTRFCFSCSSDWHEPLNCRLSKLWTKRCMDDSETFKWILANTKDCPKCMVAIEKNGGCNYMRCENKSCRYEFCWMCMGPHDHNMEAHRCNSFKESATNAAREKTRASLDRFIFYYNRYIGHQQSLKLEKKLYSTVESKMEQMEELSMSWAEVQFLRKAIDVLSTCRRTLMYTYAFAFYLENNNNKIIFENNQKDLEMATEELSGFLERDLNNENLMTLKQKVQDKYRYVEHRRKVLINHCAEGVEQDFWVFSE